MRIAVLGAGPAGLYFASLWKRRHPGDDVRVIEQNPAGATFGFGVVFSDRALEFLRADDPATVDLITPRMQEWRDMTIVHRGEAVTIDGIGFSAIGRLELLELLEGAARAASVEIVHGHAIANLGELGDSDLIVGADGVNSLVRRTYQQAFGATVSELPNAFAWYGTTRRFETLTQTFVDTTCGPLNAHHYRYSDAMSTFIVECATDTYVKAGLGDLSEAASLAFCETAFAAALGGHKLIANKSVWRRFPRVAAERWVHANTALIGDAAHTAHFSVGSGTRLAFEDAIALVKALEAHTGDLAAALDVYDQTRRPIAQKIVTASMTSAAWYADFGRHMALPPHEFAMSYIMRTGRMDRSRLAAQSPRFAAAYASASAS